MRDDTFKRIIWSSIGVILILTPLARGTVQTWSITPVLLVVAILVFLWLWRVNNRLKAEEQRLKTTSLDKPILAFFVLAVISFVFSIYKYASFYALLRLLSYIGIYYLIVNNYSRRLRKNLIGLVICIGAALSIYGLLQYFNILPHAWWSHRRFLSATYVNHNHFSGYLELVIPVTIGALIRYKSLNSTVRLALIEALIVLIAAFIFAQSRGAWISLSISLIVMNIILLKKKMLNKNVLFALVLLIVFVFSFSYIKSNVVSQRISSFAGITKGEASPQTRLKIWEGSVDMIRQSPLIGTGIGTFVWGFSRYRPEGLNARAHYAHNDYLHMTAEMGILALVIMILLLVRAIRNGLLYKGTPHPVILGCAIGMLSIALHNFVDFNFHIPANMLLFTVYAAIVAGESP